MRKYKRNIGAVLLLVLFAWYWSSVTLFPHAHNIDGHIYVHSHPFSGTSNNPGHSHTPQQFQLIAHLSLLVMRWRRSSHSPYGCWEFPSFSKRKNRPSGRTLRSGFTGCVHLPSADTHSILNGTGLLPAPVAMYMYQ